jgi:response regulator RpfG family c-di-GMP phosphodiesterase
LTAERITLYPQRVLAKQFACTGGSKQISPAVIDRRINLMRRPAAPTYISRGIRQMTKTQCDFVGADWPTLLTIDDDPHISATFVARLNQYEVHVLSAYHGMHGFWMAMTNRPNLVVTDVRMPQGSGDYVVDCLRNNSDTREIPVIILTGQRNTQIEARMRRLGVSDFFVKPVLFEQLIGAIRKHIPLKERNSDEVMEMAESNPGYAT